LASVFLHVSTSPHFLIVGMIHLLFPKAELLIDVGPLLVVHHILKSHADLPEIPADN
jgi:hypothetical protein